jgi:hypothetical protein
VRLQLRGRRQIAAPTPRFSAPPLALALAAVATAAIAVALPAPARGATAEAGARTTLFDEPGTGNKGVQVIHPQVDLSANFAETVSIAAGYNVDIVSGATPRTFGRTTGMDAVSSPTKFKDTRQLVHGGFGFESPGGGITFAGAYGWESDYKTRSISATTHHDLYEHNFTLGLAYTHNWDSVCDANNNAVLSQPLQLMALGTSDHCFQANQTDVTTQPLSIDSFEPSLSWTMTPRLVVQGGTTIQILDGFQSNPYRQVALGSQGHTPQENEPLLRQRYAVFGRLAYALPDLRASVHGMARLYDDTWAVRAVTGDVTVNKYMSQALLLSFRGHYHLQSGASFYRGANAYAFLGPNGQYWTGDRELSPMSNYLVGGKLAFMRRPAQQHASWFVELEFDAKYEIMFYQVQPDAPNADRKFAHILQGALSARF